VLSRNPSCGEGAKATAPAPMQECAEEEAPNGDCLASMVHPILQSIAETNLNDTSLTNFKWPYPVPKALPLSASPKLVSRQRGLVKEPFRKPVSVYVFVP